MANVPALKSLTQQERSAVSDARMVDAAVELICERGAAGTTLKDVGVRAGYSRGLAGYRFGSKTGLWAFLVKTIGEEWLAQLRLAVEQTSGLDTVNAAVDAHYRILVESSQRIRALYILWFDSVGPDAALREVIARVHKRRQRDVEEWIRGGIEVGTVRSDADVEGMAEHFCAVVIGIVYQWLISPRDHVGMRRSHENLKEQMALALAAGSADKRSRSAT